MKKELKSEVLIFKDFIDKYKWYIIASSCMLLIMYGSWLFNVNPRIDTEVVIIYPETFYNWLEVGRQGLILTEHVFGLRWFNPYLSIMFGYLLICVAGVLFGYLFWRCKHTTMAMICAGFGILFFSSPIFVEQFYFELQIFHIAWAFVLTALGVGFSYYGILRQSIVAKILSVLCMIWAFSSYQMFVILHITTVAFCFVLLCQKWQEEKIQDVPVTKYWKVLIGQIVLFLCAIIINTIITNMFFSGSEYLEGQILWGKGDYMYHVRAILGQIYKSYMGADNFYTVFYGIIAVLVLVSSIFYLLKNKNMKLRWLYFMAIVFIQCCPYLLTIYMGDTPTVRAQFVYPFVLAGNIVLLTNYYQKESVRIVIALLAIGAAWSQIGVSMRLIYTQDICEQEDMRLASYIEQRIDEVCVEEKTIAFVGYYTNRLNEACIKGEMIGKSIFATDYSLTPHYVISTSRACSLAQVLGFHFEEVSEEQMLAARKIALEMPTWPQLGCVVDAGEFIVVKLSEDEWTEELK